MWIVSAICAGFLIIFMFIYSLFRSENFVNVKQTFVRLPYQLIPFFLSMFVIVVALNYQGITEAIGNFLGSDYSVWVYGYTSFFASNLINNIPMSILFSSLTKSLSGEAYLEGVYASIVGSNIGAFLTPIGALAGIMFTNLIDKDDIKYSFIDFIKYGSIISLPVITIILGMLCLFV